MIIPYFQICVCLWPGSDFIANRYCLPGARGMVWTEFNWTWRQLHSGNRSSGDSSKMLSVPILLHRMNICRVLLSINALIIQDMLTLFQEQNVMSIAERALCVFHTWLVIFTPACDICATCWCLLPYNYFPHVKFLSLLMPHCSCVWTLLNTAVSLGWKKGVSTVIGDVYNAIQTYLLIKYRSFFICLS